MNADFPRSTRDQSLFLPLPPLVLSLLSFSCTPSPAASPVNHVKPILVFAGNKHPGTIIPKQNHFVMSESHWGFQRRRTRSRCWAGTEKRPHPSLPLTFLLRTPTWRSSEGGSGIYSLWDIPRTDSCLLTTVQPLSVTGRSSAAVGPCGTGCPDSCLQGYCPVTQSCPTLCNPMDRSMPGFPILHSPGVCSNSCPLSQWCHPTISSSVVPFSSRPQSFPASGSFPMSQLFTSGGQNSGASASASVLPMNIQDWFPLGWTG